MRKVVNLTERRIRRRAEVDLEPALVEVYQYENANVPRKLSLRFQQFIALQQQRGRHIGTIKYYVFRDEVFLKSWMIPECHALKTLSRFFTDREPFELEYLGKSKSFQHSFRLKLSDGQVFDSSSATI